MLDLVITNGLVVDGSGRPGHRADVGIQGKTVVAVEKLPGHAARVVDAAGLVVAPGFIDMHSHSDLAFLRDGKSPNMLHQGVTTEFIGHCGFSAAPVAPDKVQNIRELLQQYLGSPDPAPWTDLASYGRLLESRGISPNTALLVGHGTIREQVMGKADRPPTTQELEAMCAMLGEAMQQGAFGYSTGLVYAPGCYATVDELAALASVVARYDGLYCSHIRGESHTLFEAVEEALEIGRRSGARVHISHLKVASRSLWGQAARLLERLEQAREAGVEVTADAYPYTAGASNLAAWLPEWAHADGKLMENIADPEKRKLMARQIAEGIEGWWNPAGAAGWENIRIAGARHHPELEGKTLQDLSQLWGKEPVDAACDLLLAEKGMVSAVIFMMRHDDVARILGHPLVMVGSDAAAEPEGATQGKPHPRAYGTFARVLSAAFRQDAGLSLEAAVHKMTGMSARCLRLDRRGLLRPGYRADVVVFDPAVITATSTYDEPRSYPPGVHWVLVNGTVVVDSGRHTGATPGQVLARS
ncbi:MAG: D-aminoacylase [Bacillota bacterium]